MNKKIIRLSKSSISKAEKNAVLAVLDTEYLGMGIQVREFEDELSKFFSRDVACVVNGTAALHLSLQACGIGHLDEVLFPSLTYVASFQSITATGAIPIPCDIDPQTFLIDLSDARKRITNKTKAIMPVHYTGGVGDLDSIYEFAKKYNLRVIEDAAHAFGTKYNDVRVGSFGDISCFSFDGIKNITSGEGGCIITDDTKVLNRVKDLRLLGVEKDSEKRNIGKRSWKFDVKEQGWRYHMSNIMAAIGLEQLKRFSELSNKRQLLAKKYDSLFKDHNNITPIERDYDNVVPHIYVVRIAGLKNRDKIKELLLNKGIQVGYHYQPNHWLSYMQNNDQISLPITEKFFPELLTLPLHPDLTQKDVSYVADELANTLKDKY